MSGSLAPSVRLLSRLFAAALRLYPDAVRREYAAEMQAVFNLKAQDAARRGRLALLRMAFRETRDLPIAAASAHLRARSRERCTAISPLLLTRLPGRWPCSACCRSSSPARAHHRVLPVGFGGPQEAWYFFSYLGLCVLAALASLALGALRKFPRWAYPYPFTLAFALTDLYYIAYNPLRLEYHRAEQLLPVSGR